MRVIEGNNETKHMNISFFSKNNGILIWHAAYYIYVEIPFS